MKHHKREKLKLPIIMEELSEEEEKSPENSTQLSVSFYSSTTNVKSSPLKVDNPSLFAEEFSTQLQNIIWLNNQYIDTRSIFSRLSKKVKFKKERLESINDSIKKLGDKLLTIPQSGNDVSDIVNGTLDLIQSYSDLLSDNLKLSSNDLNHLTNTINNIQIDCLKNLLLLLADHIKKDSINDEFLLMLDKGVAGLIHINLEQIAKFKTKHNANQLLKEILTNFISENSLDKTNSPLSKRKLPARLRQDFKKYLSKLSGVLSEFERQSESYQVKGYGRFDDFLLYTSYAIKEIKEHIEMHIQILKFINEKKKSSANDAIYHSPKLQ